MELSERLYKVLQGAKSCDGGEHVWSLPTLGADGVWTPGAWHEIPTSQRLRLCKTGFHITAVPNGWYRTGRTVYVVETEGERTDETTDAEGRHKVAVRRARLVREATAAEEAAHRGVNLARGNVPGEVLWSGDGYGYGSGSGSGSGYGSGYGSGSGYGYGSGSGSGYGSGDGYGSGSDATILAA